MKTIFSEERLMALATQHHEHYVQADPFPHIVIDNFMADDVLGDVLNAFPKPDQFDFYKYDNPLEKKLAFDQLSKLPDAISSMLLAMNSPVFLKFLEALTGIDGLISDPYYRGGGIHQIVKGGKLDVHIDFNVHPKLKIERRLNALIYLNKNWEESFGGHFELWRGHRDGKKHILEDCVSKVLPLFNRFVVFSTSERSYHGHPEPLTCPDGWTRKSIATYYYTADRPLDEKVDAHSTTFIARPDEVGDAELEKMRDARNDGRFTSNVQSKFTA